MVALCLCSVKAWGNVVKELVVFVMTTEIISAQQQTYTNTSFSKVFKSVFSIFGSPDFGMSQMHILSFFLHFSKHAFISECRVVPVFNVHSEYLETNTSEEEPEIGHISVDL